jgi:Fe-S cluster biogenesis protein NfuA
MDQEIKITAEIQSDPLKCRFTVDRPVYEGAAFFGNKEAAAGSPVAEAIFEVEDVATVLVSGHLVTVARNKYGDWLPPAKQIGAAIRQVLQSGGPTVSEEIKTRAKSSVEIRDQVQDLLDRHINPAVGMHGGFVELLDVMDNNVFLRLGGGCQGCGAADITLKHGIEELLREHIPTVGNIFDTTDHAAGQNPYYSPAKG